jgi:hypothetical protein
VVDEWWRQYSSCTKLKKNPNGHPTGPFARDNPAEAAIYDWFAHGTGNNGDGEGDGLACSEARAVAVTRYPERNTSATSRGGAMIETIAALLRAMLTGLGLIAVLDPVSTGSLVAVAVLVLSVAALVVVALATLYAGPSGPRTHPTRHTG